MRKLIWIVLLLIALLWIAIAVFWIGPDIPQKNYDFPAAVPISPSREEIPVLISPTVKVNLSY